MSTPSAGSYPLSKPTGVCAASGRPLAVGERFVAVLVEMPDSDSMQRQDFAADAWESGARPAAPGRVFATWRSVMPELSTPKKLLVMGDDELLDLFEQLSESTDQKKLAFRYVLTLLLIRRKLLRYSGVRGRGPGSKMLVSRKPTAPGAEMPTLEVIDPGLDDETLSGAMQQIGELMGIETTTPQECVEPKPASEIPAGEGA
ncbi:MAG: hypothetical protein IT432_02945 [Phycisphaerales bacterium]|nr:hypothetical protein [Phycisphaerales bacterium]